MNVARLRFFLLGGLFVAALLPFVAQWTATARLRELCETGQAQAARLQTLRERRANDVTPNPMAHEQAAPRTHDEIEQLRGEIAQLHEAQVDANLMKRFRAIAAPAVAAAYQQNPIEPKPLPPGSVPLGELEDAGTATPEALLATMRRALQRADLDTLARITVFDPAARVKLDGWFAQLSAEDQAAFGRPERLFSAMLFNAAFPFPDGSGLETGELKQAAPNEALLHYRIRVPDGRILLSEDLPIRRSDGGWAYAATEKTASALMTTFGYLPAAQRRLLAQRPPAPR